MKGENFQDRQVILTEDLRRLQSTKEEAIKERIYDIYEPGIIKDPKDEFFKIEVSPFERNPNQDRIDIKKGIAYTAEGERIFVESDIIDIALTQGFYNYIFIKYISTIDQSVYTLKKDSGEKIYTKIDDGYEIKICTKDNLIVNNPYPYSEFFELNEAKTLVYLGYVDFTKDVLSTKDIHQENKSIFKIKKNIVNATNVNEAKENRTLDEKYTYNKLIDFEDHIRAVGSGHITASNPHGLSVDDLQLTGKTIENHERYLHSSGIVGDQNTTESSLYGIVNFISDPKTDEFHIKGLKSNEFVIINGNTIDNILLPEERYEITFIVQGTYIIYLNNKAEILVTEKNNIINKYIINGKEKDLEVQVDFTNPNIFKLWQIDFNPTKGPSNIPEVQGPPANGYSNFTNKKDFRIFGTTDSNNLSRDSATDTINISHNLKVKQLISEYSLTFKNKIINGNFDIWQRGILLSTGIGRRFLADRWYVNSANSSYFVSRVSFTPNQTEVPNKPTYYHRVMVYSDSGASNFCVLQQKIESVRTLAGKTAVLSFYAKADESRLMSVEFEQDFGSGGSPPVRGIGVKKLSLTNSWNKFIVVVNLPSISEKILGVANTLIVSFWFDAGSDFNTRTDNLGHQSGTFEIAQVQLEEGSIATDFEMRPIAEEIALCQRYYEKSYDLDTKPGTANSPSGAIYTLQSALRFPFTNIFFTVRKRTVPTITAYSPVTGTSGKWRDTGSGGVDRSINILAIGETGWGWSSIELGTENRGASVHYTADAEL